MNLSCLQGTFVSYWRCVPVQVVNWNLVVGWTGGENLLLVTLLILLIAFSKLGQSYKAIYWMLPPKSSDSLRTTNGDLEPGGAQESLHGSKPTTPWRKEGRWLRPRRQWLLTSTPSMGQSLLVVGRQSQRRRRGIRTIGVSILPNWWTTQNSTFLVRTVYAIMLMSLHSLMKTGSEHGLSIMLGCSMSILRGQALSSTRSLGPSAPLPVCLQHWST